MQFELKNVTTTAFDALNLKIIGNGLYGIVGRNGAGKSTLFTAINGEMLYKGEITVSGGQFDGRVAYVPSLDIFDDNLSASDYISLLKGTEREKAQKLMPLFQASRFFDKRIKKYSFTIIMIIPC